MSWGIYDTRDNCWIGDDAGLKVFDDHMLARIAAQVIKTQMLGIDLACRLIAKEIDSNNLRLKDEIKLKLTGEQALRRIEGVEQ